VPRIKGCPIPPDFLSSPVGLTSFMRLSLMKAAHAVTERAAHRKSGYLAFFARCGRYRARFGSLKNPVQRRVSNGALWNPTLRKIREGPRISYCAAPAMAACAAFIKESRMKFVDPTKPYRKSGGVGHPRSVVRIVFRSRIASHHRFCNNDAEASAVASCRKSNGNPSSSSQVPGFPVEVGGVVELHAAFRKESRTRGPVWCCVTGNPGYAGANLGHPSASLRSGFG
jgi:hypothetical protein